MNTLKLKLDIIKLEKELRNLEHFNNIIESCPEEEKLRKFTGDEYIELIDKYSDKELKEEIGNYFSEGKL